MVEVEFKERDMSVCSASRDHKVTPYSCPECGYIELYAQVDHI